MEIISYLKGKKAQQEIDQLQQVIGQDVFMHGTQDVIGSCKDADERIDQLERNNKDRILAAKVKKITEDTAVQLNKNALRVASLMNANRFNHINLVFDDFLDLTNINTSASQNIIHHPASSEIGQASDSANAKVVSNPISTDNIKLLTFDLSVSDGNVITKTLDYKNVESTENIEISGTTMTLLKSGKASNGVDNYHESGEIVFTPQEHSSDIVLKRVLYNTSLTPSNEVEIWIRHKESNEKEWSTYEKALSGLRYNPIMQFKMVVNNTKSTHANVIDLPNSQLSEGFSLSGSKVVTNNTFTRDMISGDSVSKYLVKRSEWNPIDKISITPSGSRTLIYHNGEYKKWVPYKPAIISPEQSLSVSPTYASASHYASSRVPGNAFDRKIGTGNNLYSVSIGTSWAAGPKKFPNWLKYSFPTAVIVTSIGIYPTTDYPTRAPGTFEIEASNDNSTWITLYSRSQYNSYSKGSESRFYFSNSNAYRHYRIYITSPASGNTSQDSAISEVFFYGKPSQDSPAVPAHWEIVQLSELLTKGMSDLSILNYSSSNKPFEQLEGDFEIISDLGVETVKIESFMSNSEMSISPVKVDKVKSININATVSSGATLAVLCSKDSMEWNEYTLSDFNSLTPDQVSALFNDTIYLKIICNRTSKASTATINSITINSEEYKTTPSISNLLYEYKLENKGVYKIQYSIDSGITWNEASTNELIKIEEENQSLIWCLEISGGQRLQCISYSHR